MPEQHPSPSSPEQTRLRMREWNRAPLTDLFPRIPTRSLEAILDKCSDKKFHYQLSQSKSWNARRLNIIAIAHVRHFHTDYDRLLRDGQQRYEARQQTAPSAWKILKDWSPWQAENETLEGCFHATVSPPSERDPSWDPMDVDSESEQESTVSIDDRMDLD